MTSSPEPAGPETARREPVDELPPALRSMWRLCRLGYQHEPALMLIAFGLSIVAAVPEALVAFWLKTLTDGLLGGRDTSVYLAAGGLAFSAVATWYLGVRRLELPQVTLPTPATGIKLLGAVLFVVLNGVLLRTLHHYADVPFRLHSMWRSDLVQASFSLFWSLLALAAMVFATRRGLRALWAVGAVLLNCCLKRNDLIVLHEEAEPALE